MFNVRGYDKKLTITWKEIFILVMAVLFEIMNSYYEPKDVAKNIHNAALKAAQTEMCSMASFHQFMSQNGHSLQSVHKEMYMVGEFVSYSCVRGHHGGLIYSCGGDGNGWRQTGGSCKRSCFPASSTVTYQDGTRKILSDVALDDTIMAVDLATLKIIPSKVTGFTYRDVQERHAFIQITLENQQILTTTDFHYTYTSSATSSSQKVLARDVEVGDLMHISDKDNVRRMSPVVDIRDVVAEGVIAPITEAGTVIVDGVYMSCYCQNDDLVLRNYIKDSDKVVAGLVSVFGESNFHHTS